MPPTQPHPAGAPLDPSLGADEGSCDPTQCLQAGEGGHEKREPGKNSASIQKVPQRSPPRCRPQATGDAVREAPTPLPARSLCELGCLHALCPPTAAGLQGSAHSLASRSSSLPLWTYPTRSPVALSSPCPRGPWGEMTGQAPCLDPWAPASTSRVQLWLGEPRAAKATGARNCLLHATCHLKGNRRSATAHSPQRVLRQHQLQGARLLGTAPAADNCGGLGGELGPQQQSLGELTYLPSLA